MVDYLRRERGEREDLGAAAGDANSEDANGTISSILVCGGFESIRIEKKDAKGFEIDAVYSRVWTVGERPPV